MRNKNTEPDEEHGPLRRSATPGEPKESLEPGQSQGWRERFPGWETLHGKPHDPRFQNKIDPNRDALFNTNLKTEALLPRNAGMSFWVWLLVIGIVLMVLMGFAFYLRFPNRPLRSPEKTQMRVEPRPVRQVNVALADSLLPLRVRHRK